MRVFLADDHAVLRAGLRLLVDAQPDLVVVGEAGDGVEAVERVTALAAPGPSTSSCWTSACPA